MTKHKADKAARKKAMNSLKRLLKDTKPISGWLLFVALISVVGVAMTLIGPEILGTLTDNIYSFWANGTSIQDDAFIRLCVILAFVYLVAGICSMSEMLIMNNVVSRHFTAAMRIRMSAKIIKLPIRYVDSTPSGEVISRMTDDVSVLGNTVHSFLNIIIEGGIKLIGIIVIIFIMQPLLAASIVIIVPLSMVLSASIASRSMSHFMRSREANGKVYALTEEDYTGFDTVKAFNLENSQEERHAKLCDERRSELEKGYYLSGLAQPVVGFTNNLSYIAICIIGGIFAINGTISVGEVVAFVLYAKLLAGPLESVSNGFAMLQNTLASAGRVYDMLDTEELHESVTEQKPSGEGHVVFEHVNFSYVKDKPLIQDLNINAKPGQKVAIVGPTGGGKTTIVNLLMRFYDVDSGRILVDGVDSAHLSREDLRNVFSMVLQDTWLFSGTIYENIAYGKDGATREEVMEAARQAHIDYFVDTLPDGYDTVINEESTNISGGQKQLLTIARAYLANRRVLILDEATSNVDTRTEILIQNTMDELMHGRTSFVIAHRLSTIVDADIILVVDNGRIVEQGTHKELLKKNGFYAEIYNSQYSLLH
ncbi:MAG TPA: ABC transporter ATP-binding protein [Eubacteriales bacterium]|nr:ABC transporter ATP-binding protein [Clostridia bacterium]HRV73481.1 ABC transporter ATP-binding protein [Eubacteriales bacterium]